MCKSYETIVVIWRAWVDKKSWTQQEPNPGGNKWKVSRYTEAVDAFINQNSERWLADFKRMGQKMTHEKNEMFMYVYMHVSLTYKFMS